MASPRSAIAATTPQARRYAEASPRTVCETRRGNAFRAPSRRRRRRRRARATPRLAASPRPGRAAPPGRAVSRARARVFGGGSFRRLFSRGRGVRPVRVFFLLETHAVQPVSAIRGVVVVQEGVEKARVRPGVENAKPPSVSAASSSNSIGSCRTSAASASAPLSSFSRHARAFALSTRAAGSPSPSYAPPARSSSRRRRRRALILFARNAASFDRLLRELARRFERRLPQAGACRTNNSVPVTEKVRLGK